YAFDNTKLTKVVVPSSVTDLGQFAFTSCGNLTAADISLNRTMVLGIAVFSGCKMDHIHIPAGRDPSYYMSNGIGWPAEYCFFEIGADGKCPAAVCPFREGDKAVGDINGDGKLNNTDIILLGRAYMAGDGAKYLSVADMNHDGRITNADIILLGRLYMTGK
ncbi:MAG: leucine-rich repeat protein, partial [Oscillospiraceae bacterium]|nr:leucine-rich repeat protein [Oscillospiraceae bacterium]